MGCVPDPAAHPRDCRNVVVCQPLTRVGNLRAAPLSVGITHDSEMYATNANIINPGCAQIRVWMPRGFLDVSDRSRWRRTACCSVDATGLGLHLLHRPDAPSPKGRRRRSGRRSAHNRRIRGLPQRPTTCGAACDPTRSRAPSRSSGESATRTSPAFARRPTDDTGRSSDGAVRWRAASNVDIAGPRRRYGCAGDRLGVGPMAASPLDSGARADSHRPPELAR
jgi:hypothetical protein